MPKELHDELDKRARKMGMKVNSEEYRRYVYGTLQKVEKRKREKQEANEDMDFEIEDPPVE